MSIYRKFVSLIGKNQTIKKMLIHLFPSRYEKYVSEPQQQVKKAFIEHGIEALRVFHDCMEKNNHPYTLAFGSILGAVREKGLIKHDFDLDTFMWIEDFSDKVIKDLIACGFKWINNYSIDSGKYGREDTFEYKGARIDVFYLYPAINKYPYCNIFVPIKDNDPEDRRMPRRVEIPVSKKRVLVPFENTEAYIPENAEEFCILRYGPNYMTPDPDWDWANSGNHMIWEEMIPLTTHNANPQI